MTSSDISQLPPDYLNLLVNGMPQNRELKDIVEAKERSLYQRLLSLNPLDVAHSTKIEKNSDIFKKYVECMDWLKEEYTNRRLEEMLGTRVTDPLIQNEHEYTLHSIIQEKLREKQDLTLIHEPRDPFAPAKGDSYEKMTKEHLKVINEILQTITEPVSLTFNNLGLESSDLQLLLPAIRSGKIDSLNLENNQIDDTALKLLAEAMQTPESQLVTLYLDKNQISDEGARSLLPILQNPKLGPKLILSLTNTSISLQYQKMLSQAANEGKAQVILR